ncbi:hypothetical protein HG537_0G02350 [Torulaspora globosa]|uniref:Golgi apparatus membrane protein TVP38 n=1 Tax=Torulaspora globosa TaxID=48254 RepID=A0A7H9HXB2_9SACH|nr:hypothetical protein HG537_0G02350 [Torulaspora sp. CBS 2947]
MSEPYEARVNSINVEADEIDESFLADLSNFSDADDSREDENFLDMYNLTPKERLLHAIRRSIHGLSDQFYQLALWKRILILVFASCIAILAILMVIFHNSILQKVVEMSDDLRDRRITPLVLILLIFSVGFPPMIGFSLLSTSTGLIYGVSFQGWLILSLGAVLGSIASFCVFKTLLQSQAQKLVHSNRRFEAFAAILQENNSYWVLALLRLCPFPYSLTNGAIAAVYGISVRNFSIAQAITTPKLLIYLFIGSRIRSMGEDESTGSKLFDLMSIIIAIAVFTVTAWILYAKTQRKFADILRRERQLNSTSDLVFDPSFEV